MRGLIRTDNFRSGSDVKYTNQTAINATSNGNTWNGQPYNNAVVENCCNGNTVTLGAGVYYFYGGISGTLVGDSATVINVDGAMTATGLGAGHPYFSAPTSGPTAGVAFYQPVSNHSNITLDGGGNGTCTLSLPCSEWDGLFYAAGASFTSNGSETLFGNLIIGDTTINGHDLNVDPTLNGVLATPPPSEFQTHVILSE